MKARLLLSLICFSLLQFSCKNDDDGSPSIPADEKYLSSITDESGNTVLSVEYDDDKRFKKLSFDGVSFRIEYNESGKVSKQFINTEGQDTKEINYSYNQNGKIDKYTIGENDYPVTYNQEENSYQFKFFFSNSLKIYLDNNDLIKKLVIPGNEENQDAILNFFYDQNHFSAFHNRNDMFLTEFISYFPLLFYQYNINAYWLPFEEVSGTGLTLKYENEYDQDNFLKKSVATGVYNNENNPTTIIHTYTYHYTQLN